MTLSKSSLKKVTFKLHLSRLQVKVKPHPCFPSSSSQGKPVIGFL